MDDQMVTILLFSAGAFGSVLLPYLREFIDSDTEFNVRKLIGQLLAVAMVIAAQAVGLVDQLTEATPVLAFAAGWGVSNVGRQIQKTVDVVRANAE